MFFSTTEHTTRAIWDAVNSERPKTRYLVGVDARVFYVLSMFVPDRIMDAAFNAFC